MKKKILLLGLFLLSVAINAQEVISTQGNSYANGTNTIDYTIGEPIIETLSDGTNNLTQGFHQKLLIITNIENLDVNYSVNIFPNPTADVVNISVDEFKGVTLRLFDIKGRMLKQVLLSKKQTSVNVLNYPNGTYLLTLTYLEDKKIKTYKIIKK